MSNKKWISFTGQLLIIFECSLYYRYGNQQTYLSKHRNSFISLLDNSRWCVADLWEKGVSNQARLRTELVRWYTADAFISRTLVATNKAPIVKWRVAHTIAVRRSESWLRIRRKQGIWSYFRYKYRRRTQGPCCSHQQTTCSAAELPLVRLLLNGPIKSRNLTLPCMRWKAAVPNAIDDESENRNNLIVTVRKWQVGG